MMTEFNEEGDLKSFGKVSKVRRHFQKNKTLVTKLYYICIKYREG